MTFSFSPQKIEGICYACGDKKQIVLVTGDPAKDRKWYCLECSRKEVNTK